MSGFFDDAPIISRYTRGDALNDGVLVDVTPLAREAGFRIPVAMTAAAWGRYVTVPAGVVAQDETGRLWDVLNMLRHAIKGAAGDRLTFTVYVRNDNRQPRPVTLKAICGPGDGGEPVITIMEPDED